jgi:Transcriptional accessory protein
MEKRKEGILSTIESQGKLTPELSELIGNCVVASELEDIYLPYRPKRRTRATMAKEKGLEPLADKMWNVNVNDPEVEARKFLGPEVASVDDALAGARDIIAERLSESAPVRDSLRKIFRTRMIESKATKAASSSPDAAKYRTYFNYSMPLQRIPSYNLLALLRAQNEGFLTVGLDADAQKCGNKMYYDFCQEHRYPGQMLAGQIRQAVDDSFKRLLEPSITNEILKEAKERADKESIAVFGDNLTQLLLSPPVGQKRTMAIDPGFRNGCKIACLDEHGNLLHHEIIFPASSSE